MLSELAYEKTESGQGIILTEYFGEGKSRIKLPEEIDGLQVVMLGEEIFMNHEALKEIILPENLQYKEARKMARLLDMGATIYYCITGKVVPEALEREFKKAPLYFDSGLNIPRHVIWALNAALELRAENRIRDMRADFQELPPTAPFMGNGDEMKTAPYRDEEERNEKTDLDVTEHAGRVRRKRQRQRLIKLLGR